MRARRGLGGPGLPALGQDKHSQQEIGGAKRSRGPSWTRISEVLQALAANERSKNKTEAEGQGYRAHFFVASFGGGDVSNVSLRHCYMADVGAGKHPRQEFQPK